MNRPEPAPPPSSGPGPGHVLVAVSDDRTTAVVARLARGPGPGGPTDGHDVASFHAVVLRADHDPLVLVEVGVPATNPRWEFRSSGLWVEAVCEQPGLHWSYGLEAFALAVDEPDELLGRGYGHRTPLGWELDFVVDPESQSGPETEPEAEAGIEVGRVEGLVLTGPGVDGEQAFAGPGWRVEWDDIDLGHWPTGIPAIAGPAVELALPLDGAGSEGPVWWVGHDGRRLTSRWSPA